jgi:hypothetical protein
MCEKGFTSRLVERWLRERIVPCKTMVVNILAKKKTKKQSATDVDGR